MQRFLLVLLFFTAGASALFAQTTIKGPTEVCGDCHDFWVDSTSGSLLLWHINSPDGTTSQSQTNPLTICFDSTFAYGAYVLTVATPNGGQLTHTVYYYPAYPIAVFQSSGAFCDAIGGNCPQVCAGTEIDYGMEYPGQVQVIIEVIGGTLIHQEQYRFTVLWDQPGQGQVFILTNDECLLDASLCVEILATPTAIIGYKGQPAPPVIDVCAGGEVHLEDLSQPAAQAFWSVSDGRISQDVNPRFTFDVPGDYTVTLVESGGCICADTSQVIIRVDPNLSPILDCVGTVCPGERVTYSTPSGCSYVWSVSPHGTILDGGGSGDAEVTVLWNSGPEGVITLEAPGCVGYCNEPAEFHVPVMDGSAAIEGPISVCSGTEASYFVVPYHGTEYTWTVSPGATILEGQGSNQIRIAWSNSPAITTGWVEVNYTNCSQGCAGDARLDVFITSPFHVRGPLFGCPGETLTFESVKGAIPLNCTWEVYNESGALVNSQATPVSVFNYTANNGSGLFSVVATQTNPSQSCNRTYRWAIRIMDLPSIPDSISGPSVICPGQPFLYTGHSSDPAFQLEWTITNGGATEQKILDETVVNWIAGGAPWRLALRHRMISFPNCVSDPILFQATQVTTFQIQGPADACLGEWSTYTTTPVLSGLDIQWIIVPATAGVLRQSPVPGSVEIQWLTQGVAFVEASVCGVSQSLPVTVHDSPVSGITGPVGVCAGATAIIQAAPGFLQYGWYDNFLNFISDQPSVGLGPGTWILGVKDGFGCTDTTSFTLASWPGPEITLSSPDPYGFCAANGETGPMLYTISDNGGYQFSWYFNGSILPGVTSSTYKANSLGTYHVVATDANGCTQASNPLIVFEYCDGAGGVCVGNGEVKGPPCAQLDYTITPGAFCNERTYTATSLAGPIVNGQWQVKDISQPSYPVFNQNTITYTYPKAGFYTVYFIGELGGQTCELIFIDTIPVSADFLGEDVCDGVAMAFTDKSTFLPNYTITDWSWDFGDPASGANNTSNLQEPTHLFTSDGNYSVTLTITSSLGCMSQMVRQVIVKSLPDLQIQGPSQACIGTPLPWVGTSTQTITDWAWDFDDPLSGPANQSTLKEVMHAFADVGSHTVKLSATDVYGCRQDQTHVVQVQANTLSGNIQYTSPLCEGGSTTLHFTGIAPMLEWSTGATGNDLVVNEAGIYVLTAIDNYGCRFEPSPAVVEILPEPGGLIRALEKNEYGVIAAIHYQFYQTCFGEPVLLGLELGGNFNVVWSTGQTDKILEYSLDRGNPLNVGTHVFTVVITDPLTGCSTTIGPMTIEVRPLPAKPMIAFDGPPPHCAFSGEMVQVTNPIAGMTYQWSSGKTGTFVEVFGAGNYSVRAIDTYGCKAESDPLVLMESPSTLLAPDGCHRACKPDTLCIGTPTWLQSWQWMLDGNPIPPPTGTQAQMAIDQTGSYTVMLTHQNGCEAMSESVYMDLFDGISQFNGQVWFDVNNNGMIDGPDTLVGGIPVLLSGPNGLMLTDTSQYGQGFTFIDVPGLGDFTVFLDPSLLPPGWMPVWLDSLHTITTCDEEVVMNFLLQYQCPTFTSTLDLMVCPGGSIFYEGVSLLPGMVQDFTLQTILGCDSIVTVSVAATPEVTSTLDLMVCPGGTIIYEGDSLLAGMVQDFTLQTIQGCDSIVTVSVMAAPGVTFSLEADSSCHQLPTGELTVVPGPGVTGPLEVSLDGLFWQNDLFFEDMAAGSYTVRVRDSFDCLQQGVVTIPAWPAISFSLPGAPLSCEGDGVSLAPHWNSGLETVTSLTWGDGSTDSVFMMNQPGTVTLTAQGLCETVTRSVAIDYGIEVPRPAQLFYVPNVWSPDFNGINDDFKPLPASGIVVEDYWFEVFDRWGNLMFRTQDPLVGWDGILRERESGQEVFVWWMKARVRFCRETIEVNRYGDVTLMIGE